MGIGVTPINFTPSQRGCILLRARGLYYDMKVSELVSGGASETDAILTVMERLRDEGRIRWTKI